MKAFAHRLLSALVAFTPWVHADPVDNWVEVPKPNLITNTLISVAAGKVTTALGPVGIFVAVGENGTILTSIDGASWKVQNSGLSADLLRVKFVNNLFFVFEAGRGAGNLVAGRETLVSGDGRGWGIIKNLVDITYFNGSYFGIDSSGTAIWRSIDLDNWVQSSDFPTTFGGPLDIEAFDGALVGVHSTGIKLSKDGVTWLPGSLSLQGDLIYINNPAATVQNNLFFRRGVAKMHLQGLPTITFFDEATMLYSNDLQHWQVSAYPG